MPTDQIIAMMIAERDKLNVAIAALQGPLKRRGRPPKEASAATAQSTAPAARRKKRTFTPAQRKEQAARMKAYWAAKKSGKK